MPPTRYVEDGRRTAKRRRYSGPYKTKWAVLVGIDRYADPAYQPLRFAASDAVALARALIEHRGFLPENVFLIAEPASPLRDDLQAWLRSNEAHLAGHQQSATKVHIEDLLFETLLSRVSVDDCALIYFAGHGRLRDVSGDPRSARPYLVPADAQSTRWRDHIDLDALLQEGPHLAANHVLYVLDACCSGFAAQRSTEQAKPFADKMLERRARQCLTAGTREQRVDDGWNGRHSPFTGYLLGLLDGSIAIPDHDVLCVSTIAAELKVGVAKLATTSRQVPALSLTAGDDGGEFVFWPRVARLSLDDQASLARLLVDEVGRTLDEPAPIQFAATLWQRILRSASASPGLVLEAQREHARTQLLLRNAHQAASELDAAALDQDADARLLRARAQLRLNQPERAATELEKLLELAADHPYADWARCVIQIVRRGRGRRHALLIGVSHVASIPGLALHGCSNDVATMRALLSDLGFTTVITLLDADATIAAIRQAFRRLGKDTQPEDAFVCYICGPGFLHHEQPVYPSYDLHLASERLLTEDDIDQAMRSIPARDKLLITDGCNLAPVQGSEPVGYRFLHGSQRDGVSWETRDPHGAYRGAFTYALEKAVRENRDASVEQLMERIRGELTNPQQPQRPGYTGSGAAKLFESRAPALEIIELAEQSLLPFTKARIEDFAAWLDDIEQRAATIGRTVSMVPLWLAVGRAWLGRGDGPRALSALCRTTDSAGTLPLIQAQLLCDRYREALDTWNRWRDLHADPAPADPEHVGELGALLETCRIDARRALLVATDDHDGATRLLERAREALVGRFGVPVSNILALSNWGRDAILSAFDAMTDGAPDVPVFFLYIGPGFDGAEIWLSTMDAAGHASADLGVAELRCRATRCSHLTSALLFTRSELPSRSSRLDDPAQPPVRDQPELGVATLVVAPHMHRDVTMASSGPDVAALEALVDVLAEHGHPWSTLDDWRRRFDGSFGSRLRGRAGAPLLPYTAKRGRMRELLRYIQQGALSPMLTSLEHLATQPQDAAEAWLQIAIVQAQRGRRDEALAAIDESLKRMGSEPHDPGDPPRGAGASAPEAYYQRGRILLALGRYAEAEGDLRRTVAAAPDHARAHYYRALAIRGLIETDLEKLRQESLHQYVKHGAPLGFDGLTTEQRGDTLTWSKL